METLKLRFETKLRALEGMGRLRSLRLNAGTDFGSNDYLGFADDSELRKAAMHALSDGLSLSSSSSRLLPGNHQQHLEAEQCFAEFLGTQSALLFNSGYDANFALLTTLPSRHDVILYDEFSHASIHEAAHVSEAQKFRFTHNSIEHIEQLLKRTRNESAARSIFIAVESVYSMDGDLAPLINICELARKYSAMAIVDEAHATGVVGSNGRGLISELKLERENVLSVHTCGKALGAAGAFIAGDKIVTDYLVNKSRSFIYTTALPPIIPVQIMNSLEKLSNSKTLQEELKARSKFVRDRLQTGLTAWHVPNGVTPIIPVIVGSEGNVIQASDFLRSHGLSVPAIRPPTVPNNSSRLRINISLRHNQQQLEYLVSSVLDAEKKLSQHA